MPTAIRIYVQPLGLIAGDDAGAAIGSGWALPLGDRLAFTAAAVWLRNAGGTRREIVTVPHLPSWAHEQGADIEAQVGVWLERLGAPPAWPRGLPSPPPLIMGVVNVTPDSFSDGGRFLDPERAIEQGRKLSQEGAVIVDVGGESTRPGAEEIPADEEIRRIVPVIEVLAREGVLVSVDTRKAAVMEAAIAAGARMLNDVSALRQDPDAARVAAASGLPVILMHSRGDPATMQDEPTYDRACLDVYDHLAARIDAAVVAGGRREQILVDPGIGFGKTLAHNLDILRHLWLYRGLGVPAVLGVSRKSFIARIAGDVPAPERLPGSLAAGLFGLVNGVSILRVHDAVATRQAVQVLNAIMV